MTNEKTTEMELTAEEKIFLYAYRYEKDLLKQAMIQAGVFDEFRDLFGEI